MYIEVHNNFIIYNNKMSELRCLPQLRPNAAKMTKKKKASTQNSDVHLYASE